MFIGEATPVTVVFFSGFSFEIVENPNVVETGPGCHTKMVKADHILPAGLEPASSARKANMIAATPREL